MKQNDLLEYSLAMILVGVVIGMCLMGILVKILLLWGD